MTRREQNVAGAPCPLCGSGDAREYSRDKRRQYLRCRICGLVFVPALHHCSPADEKKRYDLHRNAPGDEGYRTFLRRMADPLVKRLAPGSEGLDFGSGPQPLLASLFREAGYSTAIYDHFYEPVPAVLERQYDFITATEVVEHLRDPMAELDRLWNCLRQGGWLGIMTRPVAQREAFPAWHYKNDLTHIRFFSPETFRWLADKWAADLEFLENDIVLFRKRSSNDLPEAAVLP
ncbi:MAG: class I SAM-dependent methyltransferase [Nitrospirota bacterium]